MKKISIHMRIDEWLYIKSKALIPNRTKDYEDYLRRIIGCSDRKEILEREKEELENRMGYLDKEIDLELEIKEGVEELENETNNKLNQVLKTVINIIHTEKYIGLDRLEQIAHYRDVSTAELKSKIPKELRDKIVNYHPRIDNDERVIY